MSVTQYTIECGYELLKLKDTVFFLSKNSLKTITIDNGEAYATFVNPSPYPPSPNRLKGYNVKLTETESLDERYKFTKQLTMSIHGHLTDSQFLMDDDYYIVVQTEDGTYYLVNVDFPSKMTYTYNLSNGQNQTDFIFTSNSNHPTLKLNWNLATWNTCQTYQVYGIDSLKLLEKDYTTIDAEQGVINLFDGNEFKDVDFLKNTISLQEAYDGELTTTTISFEIPFSNYKPSWQYNLLEFDQNLYVAHITPKNSESGIFCGYEHGLQPSYEINGSTSDGESTTIKITLVEASNWGIFEFDTWSYYRDSTKRWVGIDGEVKCIGLGFGIHTLLEEVDGNGTPTGRYKCLEGYESEYTNYNIVGTYTESDVESFRTSVCTRFRTRSGGSSGEYTCINGNKYELLTTQISYGDDNWLNVGDEYIIGELVESASSWCETEARTKWVLNTDKYTCRIDDYENDYLTFIPLENGSFGLKSQTGETISANTYSYSTDSGQTWTTLRAGQHTGTIIKGHKVMWKWSGNSPLVFDQIGMCQFESSGRFNVEGNVMSLIYGDDFRGRKSLRGTQRTFRFLFRTCSKLLSAKNLILPATELVDFCYGGMFSYCTSLSSTPKLPATELATHCYASMFRGCTSLKTALVLPSTKLADVCYSMMFRDCTSLKTAPELPATELANGCYQFMFEGCTSLSSNVVLPALKLVNNCYTRMFYGCSSLTAVTCYAVDIAADESTMWWMNGVPSGGTFVKNSFMTNWSIDDTNGIPSTWTIDEEIPENMEYQVVSTLDACQGVDKVTEAVYELKYPSDTTSCYVTSGGTVVESCYNGCGCRTPSTLLPSDYTELVYVENANQACVDLGLQLFYTANSSFSISARVQADMINIGGYIITNSYNNDYPDTPNFRFGWENNELTFHTNANVTFNSTPDLTSAITISCSDTSSYRSSSELLLFALHNGNSYGVKPYLFGLGKIYTMTVTLNGSVVRDLIPCKRNSDNEVGLYDTVNNVFYTAMYHYSQSWHLVGGPVISGAKFTLTLSDSSTVSTECDSTSAITSGDVSSQYSGSVVSAVIGNCVTTIGDYAFRGCTSLTSVTIGNNVTSIGYGAFDTCSGLTSITIPSGVTSIGGRAFYNCSSLTGVTIGSGVTTIGSNAFRTCSALTSVVIPTSVTSIGDYAFYQCSGLTSVTCLVITPPSLGNSAFENTDDCPIYVPCESVSAYQTASGWSNYASRIEGIPPCGQPTPPSPTGLPQGYTQVEYIETDKTQYIDTGIYLNTSNFEVGYTIVGNSSCWGYCHQNVVNGTWIGVESVTAWYGRWSSNTTYKVDMSSYLSSENNTIVYKQNGVTINGSTVSKSLTMGTDSIANKSLLFFGRYDFYKGGIEWQNNFKAKSLYIKNNGELVRDFVPAKRDSDSVYGLYDLINDVFYTSPNGNNFIGGDPI